MYVDWVEIQMVADEDEALLHLFSLVDRDAVRKIRKEMMSIINTLGGSVRCYRRKRNKQ